MENLLHQGMCTRKMEERNNVCRSFPEEWRRRRGPSEARKMKWNEGMKRKVKKIIERSVEGNKEIEVKSETVMMRKELKKERSKSERKKKRKEGEERER